MESLMTNFWGEKDKVEQEKKMVKKVSCRFEIIWLWFRKYLKIMDVRLLKVFFYLVTTKIRGADTS